jgi:hypothetical protein
LATGNDKKVFFNGLLSKLVVTPSVATTGTTKAAAAPPAVAGTTAAAGTAAAAAAPPPAAVTTGTTGSVPVPASAPTAGTFKVITAPPSDYTSGEPEINMFRVFVYKAQNNEDILLGTATANRSQTLKSVIDGVKGANPNQRCIVSNGKTFITSLDPKDYYVTFGNLKLKYDQAELTLI